MKFLKQMPDNYRNHIISFLTGLVWFGIGMLITAIGTEPNTMSHHTHIHHNIVFGVGYGVRVCGASAILQ